MSDLVIAQREALRKELHEFGPFTIDVWEEIEGDRTVVKAQGLIMGWLMFFRKRDEPFDVVKEGVKEMMIDAMKRYVSQAQAWDCTQTSTRP